MSAPKPALACLITLLIVGCTAHESAPGTQDQDQDQDQDQAPRDEPTPLPSPISPTLIEDESWTSLDPITPLKHKPLTGAIGELTGDGQPDVLALSYLPGAKTGLVLLEGARDGRFVEGAPIEVEGTGLALGDFDSDGDLDALILDAGRRPSFRVAHNLGAGSFELGPRQQIPGRYGGELRQAAIADLDADGHLDAVVPLWDSLRILRGDARGELEPGQRLPSARDPFSCALADLDADGHLDLVTAAGAGFTTDNDSYESGGASMWIYRGTARGFAKPEGVPVAAISQVAIADLDGDGDLEAAATGSAGLTILDDPLGARELQLFSVASDGPLLLADLAGDPAPELVTSSYIQGRVHIVGGYPKPSKTSIEAGDYITALLAADVAQDRGRPDLVLLNAGSPPSPYAPATSSIAVVFTLDD